MCTGPYPPGSSWPAEICLFVLFFAFFVCFFKIYMVFLGGFLLFFLRGFVGFLPHDLIYVVFYSTYFVCHTLR